METGENTLDTYAEIAKKRGTWPSRVSFYFVAVSFVCDENQNLAGFASIAQLLYPSISTGWICRRLWKRLAFSSALRQIWRRCVLYSILAGAVPRWHSYPGK